MARVNTLVSNLPAKVFGELSVRLNLYLMRKDVSALAGEMGYKWLETLGFKDRFRNPTEGLLMDWCAKAEEGKERTVTELIGHLTNLERFDCVEILQSYEFTDVDRVEQAKDLSQGLCTVSLGNAKQSSDYYGSVTQECNGDVYPITSEKASPCEHDLGTEEIFFAENLLNLEPQRPQDSELPRLQERYRGEQNEGTGGASACVASPDSGFSDDLFIPDHSNKMVAKGEKQFANPKASGNCSDRPHRIQTYDGAIGYNVAPVAGDHFYLYHPHQHSLVYKEPQQHNPMIPENVAVASDKVALVIGNKNYQANKFQGLACPDADAYHVANALTELGFKVLCLVDLSLEEMRTSMLAFSKLLGEKTFAVFYYSGHGCEDGGGNYLFPVDMPPSFDLSRAIRAQEFLLEMQNRRTLMNLIIIDACRIRLPQGYASPTLHIKRFAAGNNIFAFACVSQHGAFEKAGQEIGEYCQELLKHIKKDTRVENILMAVSAAFVAKGKWAQRPNFESDSFIECRLTAPVSISSCQDEFYAKTLQWIEGQSPPDSMHIALEYFRVDFNFKTYFHNTLVVMPVLYSRRESPIDAAHYTAETFEPLKITQSPYKSDTPLMPDSVPLEFFYIVGLQKLKESLLVVLDFEVTWRDNFTIHECVKLNLGYPCVAKIFWKFSDWIIDDNPHWTSV